MKYEFIVPGRPFHKQRAGLATKDKKGRLLPKPHLYKRPQTKKYEDWVRYCFMEQYRKLDDRKHIWRIRVDGYVTDRRWPDEDNLCKVIKDALQAPPVTKKFGKETIVLTRGCLWHSDHAVLHSETVIHPSPKGITERVEVVAWTIGRL